MRAVFTALVFLFGTLAHAAHLAPYSCGAGAAYAVDVGGTEGALGYGLAVLTAETVADAAAGVGDTAKMAYKGGRRVASEVGETAVKKAGSVTRVSAGSARFSDDASALIDLSRQYRRRGVSENMAHPYWANRSHQH